MAWPVLRTLPAEGGSLEDLGHTCHLTTTPTARLTPAQRRTLERILTGLAALGLVECDETGCWRPTGARLGEADRRRAQADLEPTRRAVATERAAYRQPRHSDAWAAAHAAAVKAQRAKQTGWWASLTPSEQTRRAAALSEQFAAMSLHEQLETKHLWATHDARAGIDPKDRHAQWLARQDPDDLARRAVERAARFRAMPSPTQRAAIDAWSTYRDTWGIPTPVIRDESRRVADESVAIASSFQRRNETFMDSAARGRAAEQPQLTLDWDAG